MSIATNVKGPGRRDYVLMKRPKQFRALWEAAKEEGGIRTTRAEVVLRLGPWEVAEVIEAAVRAGHLIEVRRMEIGKPNATVYHAMGPRP